ncbi:Wadjet anti-phage system protein JetD domain-containing protein [Thiomicrorhabdus heinhorstiae]|uniref:Wadjet protein JetD C-terminal domain-containing protein n=1 Tax=Thiomicrorhabdus heinhorstiae TaxID=2748010 RepID=A0ABS0BZZ6_9GAMM|nr:Wadjet anti-phage system protein JetD domain-containing protein [Thiomicrorhabdus heinhorstiae]MBF6057571.1 hypothetical protein [Thiomicrorhabdus heinhorstiae]
MKQPNELFQIALQALVDKQEKGVRGSLSTSEKILSEYGSCNSPSLELGFERIVSEYEKSGLINVVRYKGSAGIKSISLNDYDKAIKLLNHTPLAVQIQDSLEVFETSFAENFQPYILRLKEFAQDKWKKKNSFLGCYVGDTEKLIEIVRAAIVILNREDDNNIDYRHFSAIYLSHSKRLYDIKGKVSDAIKQLSVENCENLSAEELLTSYGVVQLNHPVYLSGEISLKSNDKELNAGFDGGIGVWASYVEKVESLLEIGTVTTIENQATFEKYVPSKDTDEVVLFTSGIPSPAFKRLYKMIIEACRPNTVQHWGDIDVGGFTILNMLDACIDKPVKAFNMEPNQYINSYDSFSTNELRTLKRMKIGSYNEHALNLAIECKMKFEQESFKWD